MCLKSAENDSKLLEVKCSQSNIPSHKLGAMVRQMWPQSSAISHHAFTVVPELWTSHLFGAFTTDLRNFVLETLGEKKL